MRELLEKFGEQLNEALEIGEKATLTGASAPLANVLITGMGGSGIGGRIVCEVTAGEATVPIFVNHDYFIPNFVNKNTLFIASSYSGQTEETLHALTLAEERGAKIVCIASDGELIERAKEKGHDFVLLPSGYQPREALGYSLVQLLYVLHFLGIIGDKFKKEIKASITLLEKEEHNIQEEAKKLAEVLLGKIPVLYSTNMFAGVAIRFRQQLNENGKVLAWVGVVPEMNHNELVGWAKENKSLSVVCIQSSLDYARNTKRMEITKEVVQKYAGSAIDIFAKGENLLEQSLYLIHLGDWASLYLADLSGVDPAEIKVIDYLKDELKNFKG